MRAAGAFYDRDKNRTTAVKVGAMKRRLVAAIIGAGCMQGPQVVENTVRASGVVVPAE